MLTCDFCDTTDTKQSGTFQLDEVGNGFFCEVCDGFTYYKDVKNRHQFKLILEEKLKSKTSVPKPGIKLNKQLSPYRYPGGKSKLIDYLYNQVNPNKKTLISPFSGGASFELSLLESGLINHLHLNDLDIGVYSLWWTIKHMPQELQYRIKHIIPTHQDYFEAREKIKNDYYGLTIFEAAWVSLLVNRLAYSGIAKANPLGGRNGTKHDLLSRWNPIRLSNKITNIHRLSEKIEITQLNSIDLIEETYWNNEATIFIDPPYVEKGEALYHHYYTKDNHIELSCLLDSLFFGVPGADILVTYDYNEWLIKNLYDFPEVELVGRTYSI